MAGKQNKKSLLETLGESQVWKSIIRSGVPRTRRQRMHAVLGSVFLHLHPARLPKHAVKVGYTWCMGGLSFFLFVNLTITGILLMFYYRPTVEYAYTDIIDLTEQVPLGIMRELHRWAAHAMVLVVWLHMLRVFMTGSYKPPREFNWGNFSGRPNFSIYCAICRTVFDPKSEISPLKYLSASGAPPIPTESITTRNTLGI